MTPWGSSRAATQYLLTEEILLVVPAGHRLAELPAVPLDMLAHESILLPRATMNAGNIVADAFRRAGFEPKFSYRANYPELTKALVQEGLGRGADAQDAGRARDPRRAGRHPVREAAVRATSIFIYPRDRPLTAAARALMAHIRAGVQQPPARSGRLPAVQRPVTRGRVCRHCRAASRTYTSAVILLPAHEKLRPK